MVISKDPVYCIISTRLDLLYNPDYSFSSSLYKIIGVIRNDDRYQSTWTVMYPNELKIINLPASIDKVRRLMASVTKGAIVYLEIFNNQTDRLDKAIPEELWALSNIPRSNDFRPILGGITTNTHEDTRPGEND